MDASSIKIPYTVRFASRSIEERGMNRMLSGWKDRSVQIWCWTQGPQKHSYVQCLQLQQVPGQQNSMLKDKPGTSGKNKNDSQMLKDTAGKENDIQMLRGITRHFREENITQIMLKDFDRNFRQEKCHTAILSEQITLCKCTSHHHSQMLTASFSYNRCQPITATKAGKWHSEVLDFNKLYRQ